MKPRQYFPLGKAYNQAFCNRTEETALLVGNVENVKHSFLVAPRRYGKSSLCEKAITQLNLPTSVIDLHVAINNKDIERLILKGVIDLIGKAVGSIEKHLQSFKQQLKHLKPRFSFAGAGMQLDFDIEQHSSTPEVIREALLLLDSLLKSKNKQALMLLDEFQRVVQIAPEHGIEGGIRSAAQEMSHLSLIFSGSSRHLIESIFQDSGRPLYKLCKKIALERISCEHYRSHLNKAAKAMWKKTLPEDTFTQIMTCSERHPYYVNYLCDALWTYCDAIPTTGDVHNTWLRVVEEERSDLLREYFALPESQKKLLIYLANHEGKNIYSIEASHVMSLATTSIPKALQGLLVKDMIEIDTNNHYHLINPVYKILLDQDLDKS